VVPPCLYNFGLINNLHIRLRFYNGHLLELNESIIFEGEVRRLRYRYRFQDKGKNIVFRYDNTPHFPNLQSFPHHKHLKDEVIAIDKPSVVSVIREARRQAK